MLTTLVIQITGATAGAVVHKQQGPVADLAGHVARVASSLGLETSSLRAFETEDEAIFPLAESRLAVTVEDSRVVSVAAIPEPVAWLHISLDGGTVAPTGTRYVERGQTLTVSGELREGQSPTSRLMEELTGGPWGIEMVHELGIDLLSPLVAVSAGVISGSWTMPSDARDGLYVLSDARLGTFGAYRVKQADPSAAEFKVVRSM